MQVLAAIFSPVAPRSAEPHIIVRDLGQVLTVSNSRFFSLTIPLTSFSPGIAITFLSFSF